MHIKNIFEEGELEKAPTIKDYLIVQDEGPRRVKRNVRHYNLAMIISVGYRVRSHRGTQFRRWATERLREYEKFNARHLAEEAEQPDSDFERIIKQIEEKSEPILSPKINPCYVLENGIELDFMVNKETLIEVKYNQELNPKQRDMFDRHKAKNKLIISTVSQFLAY